MNNESIRAGLELVKEIGVISDWKYDMPNYGYNLIKRTYDKNKTHPDEVKGFLSMKTIQGFTSLIDLGNAITDIFYKPLAEKKAKIEIMIEGKLKKLLHKIENNTTIDEGILDAELGWVKVRLKLLEENGNLMKKDLLRANRLWKKYGR